MVESVLDTVFSVFHCKVFFALLEDYYQLAVDFGKLGLIVCVCVCVCMHARAQSSPTLCDPVDCSLPGSSVLGILQARILELVAISSSRASS